MIVGAVILTYTFPPDSDILFHWNLFISRTVIAGWSEKNRRQQSLYAWISCTL